MPKAFDSTPRRHPEPFGERHRVKHEGVGVDSIFIHCRGRFGMNMLKHCLHGKSI
jgi:hypothetical protein